NTYHRDGQMRVDGNQGGVPGYTPNSYGNWEAQPHYAEPALALAGSADRHDYRADDDNYFEQPRALFRLMSPQQQKALFDNTARAINGASRATIERHIHNCTQADPAYGAGVRAAIEALQSGALSEVEANSDNVPA